MPSGAAQNMESNIRLAPLCRQAAVQEHTLPARAERRCQHRGTTKASGGGCPASLSARPPPQPRAPRAPGSGAPPRPARPAAPRRAAASALSGRAGGPAARRPSTPSLGLPPHPALAG